MCAQQSSQHFGRAQELEELISFVDADKAGLMYVRGRRRVGKSTLLRELKRARPHVFYFFGSPDVTTAKILSLFAEEWDSFTKTPLLSELKTLSWNRIFSEITNYLETQQRSLTLIIDEIQWVAKTKSGCIGALKKAWQDWEHLKIKVILCGSSNRFFLTKTGTSEAILRGLKTRSDLWVNPFSLGEARSFYFPNWKLEEVALTYMMLGGIPYYLNRIENIERGFMLCINDAVFKKDTIFLEEVDEVLRLEFNEQGLKTVKKVLGSLGQDGRTQNEIQASTGLPTPTIAHILEKLCDFEITFQKVPAHRIKQNQSGIRYFMKDFYLNFFFQVLVPFRTKINKNRASLLFPLVFNQNNLTYYIPNFSGKAFELLIRTLLERRLEKPPPLYRRLDLIDAEYEVLDYWQKDTQIDLLVEHRQDRISRVIECKWIGPSHSEIGTLIDVVLNKKYPAPATYSVRRYLILSRKSSERFRMQAEKKHVGLISLEDLFDSV